jgi:hypothetical protein
MNPQPKEQVDSANRRRTEGLAKDQTPVGPMIDIIGNFLDIAKIAADALD